MPSANSASEHCEDSPGAHARRRPVVELTAAAALATLLTAGGCATVPVPPAATAPDAHATPLQRFGIDARIAVRRGADSFFANLDWQHAPSADELLVTGPLGQGLAEIRRTPVGARLTLANGEVHESPDAGELAARVFGFEFPVEALPDWLVARPHGPAAKVERDGAGRVARIVEQGWEIRVLEFSAPPHSDLPRTLALRWGDVDVKLVIDQWRP